LAADEKSPGPSLFRGVLLAHLIVALHIALIALLAVVILVIGGLARHALWIFIGVCVLGAAAAYLFYRRMKAAGRSGLGGTLQKLFEKNGEVEVRLMGGLLSFQLRNPERTGRLVEPTTPPRRLLEDPQQANHREIAELVHLLATDQITREEYNRARKQILDVNS
jgi:hypothetical protein